MVKTFILGIVLGLLIFPACIYLYFATGSAPVGTAAPPMPFEKQFAHMALDARLSKEMPKTVPLQADEANYLAGAEVYKTHCSVCHGLPGDKATAIAKGMFPKPPVLLEGKGVTDDSPGETYWKVSGGIRMTGMPAFQQSLSTDQMWQVSLLLANADKLPPSVKSALSKSATPPESTAVNSRQIAW
jgi:thiosulfate dehydrogenase